MRSNQRGAAPRIASGGVPNGANLLPLSSTERSNMAHRPVAARSDAGPRLNRSVSGHIVVRNGDIRLLNPRSTSCETF